MAVFIGLRVLEEWGFGDFQSLKANPDEHRVHPIEASQLDGPWAAVATDAGGEEARTA
jgi:hypothetical protein